MKSEAPARRAVRTAGLESHYSQLLASHAASGLSLRRFAAVHGVSAWTLYGWRRRLSGKPTITPAIEPRLVAVDVIRAQPGSAASTYEIALPGGACLRLPRDFEARRVAELLEALRPC